MTRAAGPGRARVSARQALLEAALRVFNDRGYAEASLAEIAERSGIGVGSLYHHYGGKGGLFLALWEDYEEDQELRTAEVVSEARRSGVDDPIALFVVGTRAFLEGAWEQRRIVALLDGDGPPGFKLIRQQRDREWVRRNAKLLHAEEHHRAVRVRVVVLTTMIGGAAREVAQCRDTAEAKETLDEVCRIVAQLAAPPD